MDLSAIDGKIRNLETSLGSLELWLFWATLLVVVGLILEYWHEIPEELAALRRTLSWKPLFVIVGAILITVGVAGELVVQFIASGKETELRKANDEAFSDLNAEAANARKEAGDASERAARAEGRASKNEKEAAGLRKEAESERLARVKIEESVAWRHLSQGQQSKVGNQLRPFAGELAGIIYNITDVEAATFGADVAAALQLAHWRVSEPQPILKIREGPVPLGTNPPPETGVIITSTGDEAALHASAALSRELLALGFDAVNPPRVDKRAESVIFIYIEPRPRGPQGDAKLRAQHKTKQRH